MIRNLKKSEDLETHRIFSTMQAGYGSAINLLAH
jgi:hypothetical protein